jgi:Cupin domain
LPALQVDRIVPLTEAVGSRPNSSQTVFRRTDMKMSHSVKRILAGTAAVIVVTGVAWGTASSGTSSVLVGPPTTYGPIKIDGQQRGDCTGVGPRSPGDLAAVGTKINTDNSEGWDVKIMAKDGLSVATQTITFQPGAQSGWHTHPGPVFISVKEGTMTFYEDDCTSTVLMAGQGFFDAHTGSHPHLARNETGSPATNVVTYFLPPGTTTLRKDAPQPLNCQF